MYVHTAHQSDVVFAVQCGEQVQSSQHMGGARASVVLERALDLTVPWLMCNARNNGLFQLSFPVDLLLISNVRTRCAVPCRKRENHYICPAPLADNDGDDADNSRVISRIIPIFFTMCFGGRCTTMCQTSVSLSWHSCAHAGV